jgi:large subunit ribosomal protein L24
MQIKKDDTVMVITGKDKGKKGKVLKALPKENKVIVEGINVQTKHQKQTRKLKSEIKHQEGPINASNVMFYDTKAKAPTKIGYKVEDGEKKRVSKKSGQILD